jgi:hypothetical protein
VNGRLAELVSAGSPILDSPDNCTTDQPAQTLKKLSARKWGLRRLSFALKSQSFQSFEHFDVNISVALSASSLFFVRDFPFA